MREWLRDHGLLIANLALFLIFFGGMVLSGVRVYNSNSSSMESNRSPSLAICSVATFSRRRSRTGKANSCRWACMSC